MTDTLADITSSLSTYVVAPLNAFGVGGFLFNAQMEDTAHLSADITDHYTENNKSLQDHIALKPKKITLRGLVGELTYSPAPGSNFIAQKVTQKLTTISAFLPQLSAAATQAQSAISGALSASGIQESLAALIPPTANVYSLVKNAIGALGNNQKQAAAYQYFYSCMYSGVLMGIQTPWEFLTNMAIENIVAVQSEDSIFVTDFSITFKQVRIANTQTVAAIAQGANAIQSAAETNHGSVIGATLPDPSLPGAQGSLVSASNIANSGLSNIFHFQ